MYGLRHCNHAICSSSEDISYLKQIGVPVTRLTLHHSGADPEFLIAGKSVAEANLPRSGVLFCLLDIKERNIGFSSSHESDYAPSSITSVHNCWL
jgi:hypothetical protein